MSNNTATSLDDLASLVNIGGSSGAVTVTVPSTESILSTLHARFKNGDLAAAWVGGDTLLCTNPCRATQSNGDAAALQYEQQDAYWGETRSNENASSATSKLAPHPYALAGRAYASMQRSGKSQGIVCRWALACDRARRAC